LFEGIIGYEKVSPKSFILFTYSKDKLAEAFN